ncbi:MAG: hypothetical protein MJ200_01295 [Mycoplasmoidaceae bacterium]|nr:hypothetical protein [Mycoplasmoidaceae bacterium]MCQ3908216.1 hypothetical protein [Mycoplasmoidaceae bacterium]
MTVVDAPTEVENFETDSWLTVTYFANQGFNKLAEMYGHTADPEWFIGKERDLKMNGQTYKVQVVGIKQDYLDANGTKPVALTFRFKNLVSDKDGHYMRIE